MLYDCQSKGHKAMQLLPPLPRKLPCSQSPEPPCKKSHDPVTFMLERPHGDNLDAGLGQACVSASPGQLPDVSEETRLEMASNPPQLKVAPATQVLPLSPRHQGTKKSHVLF